jgi:cell division protein FtsQ
VQIVDGNIPLAANSGYKGDLANDQERAWFKSVMNVINHMEGSKVWKGKIVQIHVDEKGELVLIPREGNERFLFGQPNSLEDKFMKMEKYYTTIIPEKGSARYSTVDVRFRGQIVCK